ncbi:MAG TPA: hypothetical protein VKB41_10915 [Steroidobacteraceae bacterium]|nr:hypothetical protein [Steroidobacteraceae bacterium]
MNVRVLLAVFALSVSWSAATWAESGIPGQWGVIPIRGSGWLAPVDTPAICEIKSTGAAIPAVPNAIHDPVAVPTYRCTLGWWDDEE